MNDPGPEEPGVGPGSVRLQRLADQGDDRLSRRFTVWAGDRRLGGIMAVADHGWARISVDDEAAAATAQELRGLVDAVTAMARAEHQAGVVLAADSHLLIRHVARGAGFGGAGRADLTRDLRAPEDLGSSGAPGQERFISDLQALLPGVVVVADRSPGRLRSFVRSAATGVVGTVHLTVSDDYRGEPLRLAVPLADDVMAEAVARAVETALAVRRLFSPLVDQVRVFYDHAVQGLRTGTYAGVAAASVRDIHLNPGYAQARELEALQRHLRQRRAEAPPRPPGYRTPVTILPPFARVDSVVAHEFWHQIENGFEGSRYHDSVQFRRAVGGYFGVETLEHVIKGGRSQAPADWQAAHARLADEVSDYATTAPKEATAELFAQWWCTGASPPPSAQAFGAILGRFFPGVNPIR